VAVGAAVGFVVGAAVGFVVGAAVGLVVGAAVGLVVGAAVGFVVVWRWARLARAVCATPVPTETRIVRSVFRLRLGRFRGTGVFSSLRRGVHGPGVGVAAAVYGGPDASAGRVPAGHPTGPQEASSSNPAMQIAAAAVILLATGSPPFPRSLSVMARLRHPPTEPSKESDSPVISMGTCPALQQVMRYRLQLSSHLNEFPYRQSPPLDVQIERGFSSTSDTFR
jgi:hypothetical protein